MRVMHDSALRRKKACGFCADKVEAIDYKDASRLKKVCHRERQNIAASNQWQLCPSPEDANHSH